MKLRRTMMFVPGNNPAMIKDAQIYGADSIMFDLEDAVSINEKDAARFLVHQALKTIDFSKEEVVVRVNGLDTPFGRQDVEAVVTGGVNVIRLPKTETPKDIHDMEALITEIEEKHNIPVGRTKMMAAVESALGIRNAYEIAEASERLIGIAIGAEDFVTNMKTTRSPGGIELLAARSQILLAARAAGIYALDTVFSNVNDEEGFRNEVELIKQLGFDGKSIVNPRQIDIVNEVYAPTQKEIEHSLRVIAAAQEAESKGSGVISLDGRMVDKPIIERAERVLVLAEATGISIEGSESIG